MSNLAFKSPSFLSPATFLAGLAGALGGLFSYFVGERVGNLDGGARFGGLLEAIWGSAHWSGAIGLCIGAVLLIYDNSQSLRGQWHRDLLRALPLFWVLSFAGGVAGQLAYSLVQNSLTRGVGWALMGASIGVGIGILRRDAKQASRGALGGALGGFLGGFVFNALAMISSAGGGSFSRLVGQIIMGALIGFLMRVVQDALKDAYLLGVSTGPYEGKQYPLNTARVTVGRAQANDISLFREETAPAQLGALVFQNGGWFWQGQAIDINGAMQPNAPLITGDTLQLGATKFRFYFRSASNVTASIPVLFPAEAAPRAEKSQSPAPVSTLTEAAAVVRRAEFALELKDGFLLRIPNSRGPISIGRSAQNSLVVPDEGVSSRHASLLVGDDGLQIRDLGSTNGTFVNEVRLAPATSQPLRIGDRVRFGQVETVVRAL